MKPLQLTAILLWLLILGITLRAVLALGSDGGMVFLTDLAHPWRLQFNADLLIHLLLFAAWVFWREKSKRAGGICALLCLMGGLFTLPYLLFALHRAQGDVRKFLLGAQA
ncbi:hypothetical protein D0B54_03775 [Solimonas sp. K1W22B-7]|uniref:hypothetical protein n=1 Tax=Solimonas sp. K1W22B-7 TaxID=2303331 RepID=UPI000E333C44|nr:hypothetical protein [Solimonas sp. K1W22B-7]AXQ27848.1 hypothetical protein D0B54_03775 [Solimonas sp. K1W22B-7]